VDRLTALVTGAGSPGIKGTLYSLKNNPDGRDIRIIGVDMDEGAIGKYLCDRFYRVPEAKNDEFIPRLVDICEKEHVDVVLPQVTNELLPLSTYRKEFENAGTTVAVSGPDAIAMANDKYELLCFAKNIKGLVPYFHKVTTWSELDRCAGRLGFPFVVKPPVSNGMRGFRVVHEKPGLKEDFFYKKPDSTGITYEELYRILGEDFPGLLLMEYLPGKEYSVDILSRAGECLAIVPRSRDRIRSGITFQGSIEKRDDIIEHSDRLTRGLGLTFAHGLQFKEDRDGHARLIESNPRIQGTMVMSTLAGANIIYGSMKLALGEEVPRFNIGWGMPFLRYWGGIGVSGKVVQI
jgi:carbamoyl-phosphate synthase large subunit